MWGCFLMSGVKILHFLKDWWKSIPIHQNYTMALIEKVRYKNQLLILLSSMLMMLSFLVSLCLPVSPGASP